MINFVQILKDDLEKGYSKSDLELVIGLPKNSLSGVIKGDKKLSKKSELKISEWQNSEKPSPLKINQAKIQMALAKVRALGGASSGHRVNIDNSTKTADTTKKEKEASVAPENSLSDKDLEDLAKRGGNPDNHKKDHAGTPIVPIDIVLDKSARIAQIEEELKHLGTGSIGKARKSFLEKQLTELKK